MEITSVKIGFFIIVFVMFYMLFSSQMVGTYNKTSTQITRQRWLWSILVALAAVLIMPQ